MSQAFTEDVVRKASDQVVLSSHNRCKLFHIRKPPSIACVFIRILVSSSPRSSAEAIQVI